MNEAIYAPEEAKAIANTILSQFAGGRASSHFVGMVGAKNIVALSDGGVEFGLKPCEMFDNSGIKKVRVELTPLDEYTVTLFGRGDKVKAKHEHVYCEDLSTLFFEATNRLPYMGY